MRWLRRIAAVIGVAVLVFVAGCAAQIGYIQYACTPDETLGPATAAFGIDDARYARAESDTFLTYPEWYIVYAYSDLAGVTRAASESSFDYYRSVRGFWSSLCGARRSSSSARPATQD